jgi:hypothetical protein
MPPILDVAIGDSPKRQVAELGAGIKGFSIFLT